MLHPRLKNSLKVIAKFAFALAIMAWLAKSGKLDFNILSQVTNYPYALATSFGLLLSNTFIVTWRWKQILELRSKSFLPFGPILQANWIGIFFNTFLPGSISGDILKIFYLQKLNENFTRTYLLGSAFLDRIMGLCGLIFLVGISTVLHFNELTQFSALIYFNLFLLLSVIAGLIILFYFENLPEMILKNIFKLNAEHKIYTLITKLLEEIKSIRPRILKLIGTSVLVHIIAVLAFWTIGVHFADAYFDLSQSFSFVPVGFITVAIPISPSGLGVGHAAFDKLFQMVGITNGASLFNIYFFIQLLINLFGIIFLVRDTFASRASKK